jgi:hypothetical protein
LLPKVTRTFFLKIISDCHVASPSCSR